MDQCERMQRVFIPIILLLLSIMVSGCSRIENGGALSVIAPDFFSIGEQLAQDLIQNRRRSLGKGERLVVTSLVDLNKLHTTSKFGRAMSESLATQLFQHGYGVEEIRKLPTVLIKDDYGEILLSREVARLAKEHECDTLVAGTYTMTPDTVIINVKMLDAISQEVLSVAGMELNRSAAINYLLAERNGIADAQLSVYEM